MTANLYELIAKAQDYTEAYARQYSITDTVLLRAIFTSHLAYLLNQ
jgi:hypothetical protein